jgi:hypothetical protein
MKGIEELQESETSSERLKDVVVQIKELKCVIEYTLSNKILNNFMFVKIGSITGDAIFTVNEPIRIMTLEKVKFRVSKDYDIMSSQIKNTQETY